jgi:rubredoxin
MTNTDHTLAEQYAVDIGKQIDNKIVCPRCRVDTRKDEDQQTLSTYGDFEDELFCPHCELDVELKVSNL